MAIANTDAVLRDIVERIVRLTEDKRGLAADIAGIKKQAKSAGYDVKALTLVVKRAMEDDGQRREREEMEAVAASMEAALGEFGSSPLGDAAIKRAKTPDADFPTAMRNTVRRAIDAHNKMNPDSHATLGGDGSAHA